MSNHDESCGDLSITDAQNYHNDFAGLAAHEPSTIPTGVGSQFSAIAFGLWFAHCF
jgi:hypothetical protein